VGREAFPRALAVALLPTREHIMTNIPPRPPKVLIYLASTAPAIARRPTAHQLRESPTLMATGRELRLMRGRRLIDDRQGRQPRIDACLSSFLKEAHMSGFRPLHDRVLVRRVEAEERTPAGIIIPDTAKEKPIEGEVLAVGPGARDETGRILPLDVKVGDRVLFGKWAGTDVLIDGEDRLILKEADILGVMEGTTRAKARAA
jgi:chaperonin GroES